MAQVTAAISVPLCNPQVGEREPVTPSSAAPTFPPKLGKHPQGREWGARKPVLWEAHLPISTHLSSLLQLPWWELALLRQP